MSERVYIMGTPIDNVTVSETISLVSNAIESNTQIHHTVVNAGKIVLMHENPELRNSVIHADLINADGQAIIWASKLLGQPLKERVTGIDLMEKLVELAAEKKFRLFFFGAREEVVSKLVKGYEIKYGKEVIAGYRNGYFKKEEERSIAEQIAQSQANILFVAISSPTKENFLYNYKQILKNVNFIMGVGGSFDVITGYVKRAPLWMQKNGLEWLYRVYQEPKRMFRRYLVGNTKFAFLIMKYFFQSKKN